MTPDVPTGWERYQRRLSCSGRYIEHSAPWRHLRGRNHRRQEQARRHFQIKRPWYACIVGGTAARVEELLCSPIVLPARAERGRRKAPSFRKREPDRIRTMRIGKGRWAPVITGWLSVERDLRCPAKAPGRRGTGSSMTQALGRYRDRTYTACQPALGDSGREFVARLDRITPGNTSPSRCHFWRRELQPDDLTVRFPAARQIA